MKKLLFISASMLFAIACNNSNKMTDTQEQKYNDSLAGAQEALNQKLVDSIMMEAEKKDSMADDSAVSK